MKLLSKFRRKPITHAPTIAERRRMLDELRPGLAELRRLIADAEDQLAAIETNPETALVLNARLALYVAQARWMERVADDYETALQAGGHHPHFTRTAAQVVSNDNGR